MKKNILLLGFLLFSLIVKSQSIIDYGHLLQVKSEINKPKYSSAYAVLMKAGDKSLKAVCPSVMTKKYIPKSGDKHDYMSLARYYWPDSTKADFRPYISRDGQSNPELDLYDRNLLGEVADYVENLTYA